MLPSLLKPAIHAVAHVLQDSNLQSFIVGEHAFEFAACVTSTSQMVDFGRSGQTRTGDVLIPNQVHCQLCYTPNFKTCIRSSFLIYAGSGGWTRTNVTEVMGLLRNPFSTPQSKKNLIAKCTKGEDHLAMCCHMAAIC